jgi:DNA-directed RNA polymerase subunit E'/Rpb7
VTIQLAIDICTKNGSEEREMLLGERGCEKIMNTGEHVRVRIHGAALNDPRALSI